MQTIKLNLIPGGVLPVVNVSQYDVGRQFAIQVYEGAASYNLTGKSVQIRGTKPDGNGFAYDSTDGAISVSGNTVTVTTLQQMTACGGDTTVELRITASGVVLGTLNFILAVEASALSDDTPISDTDIPAIERDFQAALDEAEADALKAEGHAQGTQDGEAVGSSSPYYHNNAKYYKEQADIDATNAGNSATTATNKAGEAATSATNAGNSATNAAADALVAEGYANGTQNGTPVSSGSPYYQANGKYFEQQAGHHEFYSADYAKKSEGFAVGKQNGTPVASGSPYYQNNAAYYAAQAAQYATGGLIYKGSIAFASLPTTGLTNGDMYNITDDFTTDNRFVEGAGITVKAGSNIAYIAGGVDKWDILATGGGVSDMSDLQDVSLSSLADGDLLQYDGTAAKWENSPAIPNALGAVRDNGAVNRAKAGYTSNVLNGITWTANADDTLSGTGVVSGYSFCDGVAFTLQAGDYILSGRPNTDKTYVALKNKSTDATIAQVTTGSYLPVSLASDTEVFIRCGVTNGFSESGNILWEPMVYPAALGPNVPWNPHAMTNRELTEEVKALQTVEYVESMASNGTNTYRELLYDLASKADYTKIKHSSYLVLYVSSSERNVLIVRNITSQQIDFIQTFLHGGGAFYSYSAWLDKTQSECKYRRLELTTAPAVTVSDWSTNTASSGRKFILYY